MRIISGKYGSRTLKTCEGSGYRPATSKVRQAIFSMLEARGLTWPDLRVLDIFAGSGSLAIEALSRGAQFACFIEKSAKAVQYIQGNLKNLGISAQQYQLQHKDALALLQKPAQMPFELIFIDPPYRQGLFFPAIQAIVDHAWLATNGFLLAEIESDLQFTEQDLPAGLFLCSDRNYGQTRILLCSRG